MKFIEVAQAFAIIEKENSRLAMTKQLAELLHMASGKEAGIICNLSLGMLRPPYQGTKFNLAEKSLIKIVTQVIDMDEKTVNAQVKKMGDIGEVIALYWHKKPTEQLTLLHVYKRLVELEHITGVGSQEEKAQTLVSLLKQMDSLSAKYIIRMVLGILRLGFSDMTLIDALSWMQVGDKSLRTKIEHAYNICVDIGLVAQTLKDEGIQEIERMKIHIGIPIRPAAAERLPTAQEIFKKLGPCVAQPKLDGFRLQIHMNKKIYPDKINFFSRHLTDMSEMFPDILESLKTLHVQELIVEGEAIAFDADTGMFLPFQETVKRRRKHEIEQAQSEYPLRVFLFDLLYVNGQSYLNKTHEERRNKLIALFKHFKNDRVHVIAEREIKNIQDLQNYFNHEIAEGLEGIVVKKPDALYQPGKRNFNWIKYKRQEEGHLEDTLDCVILGYYTGSGKRTDFGIGAFLVGIFHKIKDHFETIAKIGTGLKDDEWRELKKKCDALKSKGQPKNVLCAKELIPDIWVYPEIVCAIRADEITRSPLHSAGKTETELGYALRFPRFMGYRPDKGPEETTILKEVVSMYKDQYKT